MVFGYKVKTTQYDSELDKMLDDLRFMCIDANGFSEGRYKYYKEKFLSLYESDNSNDDMIDKAEKKDSKIPVVSLLATMVSGPMDSPWPMQSHDLYHTGRSPYSTVDTYAEIWRFKCDWAQDTPSIDSEGIVYVGCGDRYLYAVYPNGTLKWKHKLDGNIWGSSPAIAEDGTIYVGSWDTKLYAINPNGTLKWKTIGTGGSIASSPAIAEDGTIYFGHLDDSIVAVNPNGTIKWSYKTGYSITSDPAIGDDGTIYIGSGDSYLYALYPNGTLRWRFKTGDEIHGHPSIADDGTIYIGSNDDYIYAVYPNGTMKWKTTTGWGMYNAAAIDIDGTIYVGDVSLCAIYPNNGTKKWVLNLGNERWVGHSSPAISADGIIYIGTHIGEGAGGEIIAVNPDGTERWRKKIADEWVDSSPSIAEDGTVYVGSASLVSGDVYGFLHAFGPQETNDSPTAPSITGPTTGKAGTSYDYKFVATDPDRNPVSYYVKWGDGTNSGWTDDYNTGEEITLSHAWSSDGTFTIKAKARDTFGAEGPEASLIVTMPRNRAMTNLLLMRFLERFPILQKILLLQR